jgi:hypothetical protein
MRSAYSFLMVSSEQGGSAPHQAGVKRENRLSERRNGNGSRPGVGMLGMREGATALGGTFEAGPCRDGFRIVAELPYRRNA